MLRTLRNYVFWAYERGSLHYDIMVTAILLFVFITPHLWNYNDRPVFHLPSQVMVDNDGSGELVYQVRATDVQKEAALTGNTDLALRHIIEPIAGDVRIEHYEIVPGTSDNHPVAYKVWAHR